MMRQEAFLSHRLFNVSLLAGSSPRCGTFPLLSRRAFYNLTNTTPNGQHARRCRRHAATVLWQPRKRDFFSTNASLTQQQHPGSRSNNGEEGQKKKATRSTAGNSSLRRVAVEAQRSRDTTFRRSQKHEKPTDTKTVTAYCATERFDLTSVVDILTSSGHTIDPCETGLESQVVHIQIPLRQSPSNSAACQSSPKSTFYGDLFIFSSGTLVSWALPSTLVLPLLTTTLLPAMDNPHLSTLETEDLEYMEDPSRENSSIRGDTITIGTRTSALLQQNSTSTPSAALSRISTDTTLAKIAFSSGLSRSTKLAVLESLLSAYFDSTRSIPTLLSRGSRLPFTRSFILRKTGQLLSVRAQLNLYSELTDSLPDLFWDSRHELGLEGYYDQVGRALDVGVRIKVLNEKMDYAQEIASVLRERLSERHGLVLEWMIIALIAVEVGFEVNRLLIERAERLERS